MKKASKVMYIIALVLTIIGLVAAVIMDISGILAMTGQTSGQAPDAGMTWAQAGATTLGFGIYLTITSIVSIIFLVWAKKSVGKGNTLPHILAIVIGVIGGDIFLILGGIFGILAIKQ